MRYLGRCIILFCVCSLFVGCSQKPATQSRGQLCQTNYNGGQLYLQVETNKAIYSYDEFIYITATLINTGSQPVEILMHTNEQGIHREVMISLLNGNYDLIDVDMHKESFIHNSGILLLQPGERCVQNMRYSTRYYKGPTGNYVKTEVSPIDGQYTGIALVNVINNNKVDEVKVEFTITVEPELSHTH